jgi:uncharacterized protein
VFGVRIAGNYTFEATREEVWSAINDPEVLAHIIPGCQRLDQVGENEFESVLKVGLQAVRGTYTGRVKIDNVVPHESYDIHVDGKGSNGFLKGNGGIKLRSEGTSTILDYGGEAQIGGTIASVGQRLIDGASKTLINQSLKALAATIEERRHPGAAAAAAAASAAATASAATTASAAEEPVPPVAEAEGAAMAAAADTPVAAEAPAVPATPVAATPSPSFERRTIVVPEGKGLSDQALARGVVEDFLKERPWFPWVLAAFFLGILIGRRR